MIFNYGSFEQNLCSIEIQNKAVALRMDRENNHLYPSLLAEQYM
ncbi:MAG: hypothetical protein ACI9K1_001703 [Arcticibacterium sp.]